MTDGWQARTPSHIQGNQGAAPQKPLPGFAQILQENLNAWGLGSLTGELNTLARTGASAAEINLKLQQTAAWKARFAGNEARMKAGLGPLSPAAYIGMEDSYRQTLRAYGLPQGFFDNKAATDAWIGGDVSASELADRAKAAADLVYNSPKSAMDAWDQFYGGGTGGAIAAILDPKTADPLVQQKVAAAQIGGSALDNGLTTSVARATQLAQSGVTLDSARQAYAGIASRIGTDKSASGRFHLDFGQTQEEDAALLGSGGALTEQSNLYAMEASQFAGHGGATDASGNVGANY